MAPISLFGYGTLQKTHSRYVLLRCKPHRDNNKLSSKKTLKEIRQKAVMGTRAHKDEGKRREKPSIHQRPPWCCINEKMSSTEPFSTFPP